MGASGSGKTSLLRAIAGLWRSGKGTVFRFILPAVVESNGSVFQASQRGDERIEGLTSISEGAEVSSALRGSILFLPQRPYMVLGTLRQQLLYPTWSDASTVDEVSKDKGMFYLIL